MSERKQVVFPVVASEGENRRGRLEEEVGGENARWAEAAAEIESGGGLQILPLVQAENAAPLMPNEETIDPRNNEEPIRQIIIETHGTAMEIFARAADLRLEEQQALLAAEEAQRRAHLLGEERRSVERILGNQLRSSQQVALLERESNRLMRFAERMDHHAALRHDHRTGRVETPEVLRPHFYRRRNFYEARTGEEILDAAVAGQQETFREHLAVFKTFSQLRERQLHRREQGRAPTTLGPLVRDSPTTSPVAEDVDGEQEAELAALEDIMLPSVRRLLHDEANYAERLASAAREGVDGAPPGDVQLQGARSVRPVGRSPLQPNEMDEIGISFMSTLHLSERSTLFSDSTQFSSSRVSAGTVHSEARSSPVFGSTQSSSLVLSPIGDSPLNNSEQDDWDFGDGTMPDDSERSTMSPIDAVLVGDVASPQEHPSPPPELPVERTQSSISSRSSTSGPSGHISSPQVTSCSLDSTQRSQRSSEETSPIGSSAQVPGWQRSSDDASLKDTQRSSSRSSNDDTATSSRRGSGATSTGFEPTLNSTQHDSDRSLIQEAMAAPLEQDEGRQVEGRVGRQVRRRRVHVAGFQGEPIGVLEDRRALKRLQPRDDGAVPMKKFLMMPPKRKMVAGVDDGPPAKRCRGEAEAEAIDGGNPGSSSSSSSSSSSTVSAPNAEDERFEDDVPLSLNSSPRRSRSTSITSSFSGTRAASPRFSNASFREDVHLTPDSSPHRSSSSSSMSSPSGSSRSSRSSSARSSLNEDATQVRSTQSSTLSRTTSRSRSASHDDVSMDSEGSDDDVRAATPPSPVVQMQRHRPAMQIAARVVWDRRGRLIRRFDANDQPLLVLADANLDDTLTTETVIVAAIEGLQSYLQKMSKWVAENVEVATIGELVALDEAQRQANRLKTTLRRLLKQERDRQDVDPDHIDVRF